MQVLGASLATHAFQVILEQIEIVVHFCQVCFCEYASCRRWLSSIAAIDAGHVHVCHPSTAQQSTLTVYTVAPPAIVTQCYCVVKHHWQYMKAVRYMCVVLNPAETL
jgi:hypothetical protein